jgi:hypothetical protein
MDEQHAERQIIQKLPPERINRAMVSLTQHILMRILKDAKALQ